MRRWTALALLAAALLLRPISARADSALYTYASAYAVNVYAECEDFDGDIPPEVLDALSGRLYAGDEILCGAVRREYLRDQSETPRSASALVAVRRQGRILLFGIADEDGVCYAALETDCFFADGQDFAITVLPDRDADGKVKDSYLALTAGEEAFLLSVKKDGGVYLREYRCTAEDGAAYTLLFREGSLSAQAYVNGALVQDARVQGLIPQRLCGWTYESIPAGMAQVKAYAALNPVSLEEDEAVIYGVNFRRQDTTRSSSMGMYTAKARLLEKPEGASNSWSRVAVGDTQGWVSNTYLIAKNTRSNWKADACGNLSAVLPAARAKRETALLGEPGGSGRQKLSEGTLMHVLAENDGWLHVIIPRGEMTWKTDWEGTYGYVQADSVTTGLSIADAVWR